MTYINNEWKNHLIDLKQERHTHSYKTMWQDQVKNNRILIGGMLSTIIFSFVLNAGAIKRNTILTQELEEQKAQTAIGLRMADNYSRLTDELFEKIGQLPQDPEMIIRSVFKDKADQALRVAKCESGLNPKAKNKTSSARGLFQVMASVHQVKESWLYDPMVNTLIAKKLYDASGWTPWVSSSKCSGVK